jgi:hypothetical protein
MNKGFAMVIGAGMGASLMYFFDPGMGRRRRALVRDQGVHLARRLDDAVDVTSRDLTNRAAGSGPRCGPASPARK